MEVSFALIHVCFGTCVSQWALPPRFKLFCKHNTTYIFILFLFYVGMNVSRKRNDDGIDNSFVTLHAHDSC